MLCNNYYNIIVGEPCSRMHMAEVS